MKRMIYMLLALTLLLSLTACGESSNGFFADASPSTSALTFYVCDGSDPEYPVRSYHMFNGATTREILDKLEAVKVKEAPDWTPEDVSGPVYGFDMGKKDGFSIRGAWCNGHWICDDGSVYTYDFDFEALMADYEWDFGNHFRSTTVLPCSRHLTMDEQGWYAELLQPSADLQPPENITLELVSQESNAITLRFENTGREEWMFGEYYALDVLLDGAWYEVPPTPGNWGFNDIGYMLSAGDSREESYLLTMYGELPAGTYRIVVYDLSAEFVVE